MKKALNTFIILTIICFGAFFFFYCYFSIKYPNKFDDEILFASNETGVDVPLIKAVCKVESSFNEKAISKAGAVGVMQILPSTAKYVCELNSLENDFNLFEPKTNILIGCYYIKYLQGKYQNLSVVLACYNAGEGNVNSWLKNMEYSDDGVSLKKIPFKETQDYVRKVNQAINFYKKQ